jgi:hypothetical protein
MDKPDSEALLAILRSEPFNSENKAPLPRRKLGPGTLFLLVLLRLYVIAAIPILIYAFIHGLSSH